MVKHTLAQLWAAATVVSSVIAAPQPQMMARNLVARGNSDDYKTCTYFYLQTVVPGKKYQKQNWISIGKDGDGHTTCNNTEASLFHLDGHQLQYANNYTEFTFTNGYSVWSEGAKKEKDVKFVRDDHYLDIITTKTKQPYKAQVCVAEDTTVFVQATCETPFKCLDIEIMPVCAYYPDGKLYDGGYEKPCDDNSQPYTPVPAPKPQPCPTQKPSPCPEYQQPAPHPDKPCPTPTPCPDNQPHPDKPCPPNKPSKPCPTDNNGPYPNQPCPTNKSPPSKPCPPNGPPSKPCPTKSHPPCPDPSSDPDPHPKREVQAEFDD